MNEQQKLESSSKNQADARLSDHKIGTVGVGAIAAALGALVGGPVGAVFGFAIGSAVAQFREKPSPETKADIEEHWRKKFLDREYVQSHQSYTTYAPAYRTGYEGASQHLDNEKTFEEIEPQLQQAYEQATPETRLSWDQAKHAARDAYMQLYEERLITGKHRVKTGEVAIAKHIETETAQVAIPVEKERVIIERSTPSHEAVSTSETDAFQAGQMTRLEVFEEMPEIHKEAFVREEVRIRKEVEQDMITAEEQLRHEVLDIATEGQPVINASDN